MKAVEKRSRSQFEQKSLDNSRNVLKLQKEGSSVRSGSLSELHHRSKGSINPPKDSLQSIK